VTCALIHKQLADLDPCASPSGIPFADGLYFFYENGEDSPHGPDGRIVRVGNHPRSDRGLVRRLRHHYSGRKNGSVFRKFLGGALIRRENPDSLCLAPMPGIGHWERQGARACERCWPVEARVSALLRERFRFRCVWMPNREERNRLEGGLVAALAQCTVCQPSADWLGRFAYSPIVRESGLWNVQFADGVQLTIAELARFGELVAATAERSRRPPEARTP
jgi:hypothetical protein